MSRKFISQISPHAFFVMALLLGAIPFIASLVAEFGFDLKPCKLCLIQRYLFLTIALLAVSGYLLRRIRTLSKAIIIAILLTITANFGTAFYHSLVERKLIQGPDGCSGGAQSGQTLEEIRAQIMGAATVSCDTPAAKPLGLSFAEWNVILSLLSFIILLRLKNGTK